MKCRICNKEVGNSFQLVCDNCTAAENKRQEQEETERYELEELIK